MTQLTAEPVTADASNPSTRRQKACPILGDVLYGGHPRPRVFACRRPAAPSIRSPRRLAVCGRSTFDEDSRQTLRAAWWIRGDDGIPIDSRGADGWPGCMSTLGDFILSQSNSPLAETPHLPRKTEAPPQLARIYTKLLNRACGRIRPAGIAETRAGWSGPRTFHSWKTGRVSKLFCEGYSTACFSTSATTGAVAGRHVAAVPSWR